MAISIKDRIKQGTNTTGAGTVSMDISYSASGFQDFSVLGNGTQTYYAIEESPSKWEVGIGTYNAGTLSRDTILSSSNANNAVSLGGSGLVFVTYPAEKAVFADSENNVNVTGLVVGATGVKFNDGTIQTTASTSSSSYDLWTISDGGVNSNISNLGAVRITGAGNTAVSMISGDPSIVTVSGADQDLSSYATTTYVNSASGALQSQVTSNDGDISTVSGLTVTNTTNLASTGATNAEDIVIVSGIAAGKDDYDHWRLSANSDSPTNISRTEEVRFTAAGSVTVDLDTGSNILTMSGTDQDLSPYATVVDLASTGATNAADIVIVSGLTVTNATDISSNDTDISNLSGLVNTNTTNIALTGATNATNIATVSGIAAGKDNYQYWTVTDGSSSDNIISTGQVKFTGAGHTTVSYSSNVVTVSGTDQDLSSYATTGYVTGVSGHLQTQITNNIYTWQATGVHSASVSSGGSPTGITISQGASLAISGTSGISVNLGTGTPDKFVVTHDDTSALGPGGFSLSPNDFLTKVQVDEYGHVTGLGWGATTGIGGAGGGGYDWTVADENGNSETISSGNTVYFSGIGTTDVTYYPSTNTVAISGAGGGATYAAGTGLALAGTVFSTSGTGTFDVLDMTVLASGDQPPYQEGVLFYDEDSHTLTLFNDESDISLQVGQEQYIRVRNNTLATIVNGSAVRITGAHSDIAPEISLASADTNDKSLAIGLASHSIETGSFGYVSVQGIVYNLNTTGFNEGQELYLSTTSGGLTGVSPVLPNYSNSLGVCIRSHATSGSILVNLGKSNLGGGDVKSTAVVNVSGIPFYTQAADGYAGGVQTDTYLAYDSGNTRIELGGGGIKFYDGTTQTTAPVAGSTYSYWTATDGGSSTNILNTDTVKLTGAGNTTVTLAGGVYTINGTGGGEGGGGDADTVYAWSLCGSDVPSGTNVTIGGGHGVQVTCGLDTTINATGLMASGDGYESWHLQGDGGSAPAPNEGCTNNISVDVQKSDTVEFNGKGSVYICSSTAGSTHTLEISGLPKYQGWDAQGFFSGSGIEKRVESEDDVMFTGVGSVDVIMSTGVGSVKYIVSGIEGNAYSGWRATDGVTINKVIDNELVTWTGVGNTSVSMTGEGPTFSISGADTIYLGGSGIEISGTESPYTINGKRATTGVFGMTYLDHDISGADSTTAATPLGVRDYVRTWAAASGYPHWTITDGSNSENISGEDTVKFTGGGATTAAYNASNNTLTVSSTDNNTTYTAGDGLELDGTEFNVTGMALSDSDITISGANGIVAGPVVIPLGGTGTIAGIDASTSVKGVVQLQDSAEDGVVDKAITPNAVYDISGALTSAGYQYWNVSDGSTSENISGSHQVIFAGAGDTTTSYNTANNTLTITSTDSNTQYTAGTGLNLDPSTTFNVSGSTIDNSGIVQLTNTMFPYGSGFAVTPYAVSGLSGVLAADISTNATNIAATGATNAAAIATNVTNIATNVTNIAATGATNAAAIATNVTNIAATGATNAAAIATNVTNIATNATNIAATGATNAAAIATNVTNIATNATNIAATGATNAAAIATNVTNIATNVTNIATNATNIAATGATNAAAIAAITLDTVTDNGPTTTNNITVGTTTTSGVLTPLISGSGAASVTFDLSTASTFTYTIDETTTLALSNVTAGQKFMIRLKQDTTGSRGVNWFSTTYWAEGGTAPTLTTDPYHSDVFGFLCTTSGYYDGFVIGQNISGA